MNRYLGDASDLEEPEDKTDNSLEMQASRGSKVGAK